MDRKKIADALGVSEKTVSRYVASGRLPDRRIGGALDVSADEVEALRVELQTPVEVTPEPQERAQGAALAIVPGELSQAQGVPLSGAAALSLLASIGAALEAGQSETGQGKPRVPVSDKLLLSIVEASALSGASAAAIRAAIKANALPSAKVGRGQKVRRGDLSAWVDGLFAATD